MWKESTKLTPYEVTYETKPPTLLLYVPATMEVQDVEQHLQSLDITLQFLKDSLKLSQERTKKQADNERIDRTVQVDDWVYLKLWAYGKISTSCQKITKLSPKYYGPFKILIKF